jgi:hypothetical protein
MGAAPVQEMIPDPEKKYSVGENAGMSLKPAGGIVIHVAAKKSPAKKDEPAPQGLAGPQGPPGPQGRPVLRECQARAVLLGLQAPLVHRDRPDFALPRRVVIRPSAKFPVMRTNTYSMLTHLMQREAWSITMTADYHLHPLVAADSHALVPARSS